MLTTGNCLESWCTARQTITDTEQVLNHASGEQLGILRDKFACGTRRTHWYTAASGLQMVFQRNQTGSYPSAWPLRYLWPLFRRQIDAPLHPSWLGGPEQQYHLFALRPSCVQLQAALLRAPLVGYPSTVVYMQPQPPPLYHAAVLLRLHRRALKGSVACWRQGQRPGT